MIKLEVQQLIDSLEERTFEEFKSKLTGNSVNIFIKEWDDSDLVMLTNNFTKNNHKITNVERECRSMIVSKTTLEIICYTYDDIYYNQEAKDYLIKNNTYERKIQECFEGTLLSLYYYNDKWNIATRRCIDASNSIWMSNKSHFDMFTESINTSFDDFVSYLKTDINYFFVLVHHQNKHIVDYTEYFNDNEYKKVIHVMSRDRNTHSEIDINDDGQWEKKPHLLSTPKSYDLDEIFFKSNENVGIINYIEEENEEEILELNKINDMKNFSKLDDINKNNKLDLPVKSEGLIVKVTEPESNKTVLLKFQTNSYQFMSMLKPNSNNIYMSFIELYQNDMLKRHLEYFPGNSKFDTSGDEVYDTIGIIDAVFKVQTSELFELFRSLYNLKDCSHKNEELYNILPTEYTVALYRIRGIYYKKKEKYIKSKQEESKQEEINPGDPGSLVNTGLRIFDIYNMLKYNYDTKELLKLLRARKLLINKCLINKDSNSMKILNLSNRCDKVSIKMMAVLLNKMFPKESNLQVYSKKVAKENYGNGIEV